jgi:hypothetical protein
MPKLKEIGKTSSTPNILQMALPDAATRAFWKMTADDRDEYASRIAKFSRSLGKDSAQNATQSLEYRRRNSVASDKRQGKFLGRTLTMPNRSELESRLPSRALESKHDSLQGVGMKAPGVRARKTGKKLARGRALQVMCYPRLQSKQVLVEASRETGLALSSFILLASLKEAAALRGCPMADMIPPEELLQYRKPRANRKRSRTPQV